MVMTVLKCLQHNPLMYRISETNASKIFSTAIQLVQKYLNRKHGILNSENDCPLALHSIHCIVPNSHGNIFCDSHE